MKRREFIGLLGGAAAWPLAGRARQPAKLATIGLLGGGSAAQQSKWTAAFLQRLQELGWIEGRNIAIEYRWTEGSNERAAEFAAEFVRLKVDVIVTSGTPIVIATKRATSVIPIIFARPRYTRLSCKNDYLPTPNHVNRSAASALLTDRIMDDFQASVREIAFSHRPLMSAPVFSLSELQSWQIASHASVR
jgi:ABC transporter substrate binding protein